MNKIEFVPFSQVKLPVEGLEELGDGLYVLRGGNKQLAEEKDRGCGCGCGCSCPGGKDCGCGCSGGKDCGCGCGCSTSGNKDCDCKMA